MIKVNIVNQSKCTAAYDCTCEGSTCDCTYLDENGEEASVKCPKSAANTDTKSGTTE